MARTDATRANGYIPEPVSGEVLTRVYENSAVEQVARKVKMTSDNIRVPRFDNDSEVDSVAEDTLIPLNTGVMETVLIEANKFANRMAISLEDERDSFIDILNLEKLRWADKFARTLDNACFGVTAASTGPGTDIPFESVYFAANAAGNKTATAGDLSYEDLVALFAQVEDSEYGDGVVVVAHPAFAMALRNLKDAAGDRVVADPLGSGVPSIFGRELRFSRGLRTSATMSHKPAGNPLLVVGPKEHLILGVRDGVESELSREARWDTDGIELKMRARRAFKVATPEAFHVIEKTAV